MKKMVRGLLLSGALVAAMCTGLAVKPAEAYWYGYGRVGGVRVGVGVGGVRVGVGYRGYYGYREYYGYRAGYGVRVGYPGYRYAPVIYPAPVVFVGPPMPEVPFNGHG